MTVRIGSVWDSTQQVLAGRAAMLIPFAAIGFVLPSLLQLLVLPQGGASSAGNVSGSGLVVTIMSLVLGVWAQLGIMALATHPATTSAEASRVGFRRFFPVLGLALAIGFVVALLVLVFIIGMVVFGFDFTAAMAVNGDPSRMPPMPGGAVIFAMIYFLVALPLTLWLVARLMLTYAVVLNERRGLGAFRRSIALTRGMTWRLIGMTLLFLIVLSVSVFAVQGVTGAVFRLILGPDMLWLVLALTTLASAVVSAAFMTLAYVFVARLYVATAGEQALRQDGQDGSPQL
ncbi:hypothetical protein [Sphingomonas sp. 2378]|uniref:hypothetical protein n=1 Tax=Sphingomonas sp. 2378 TaxID=1219748 RepID=UPI00311B1A15